METKNYLDDLLTSEVFVNGKKSSIYKRELFAGLLDDDKKSYVENCVKFYKTNFCPHS